MGIAAKETLGNSRRAEWGDDESMEGGGGGGGGKRWFTESLVPQLYLTVRDQRHARFGLEHGIANPRTIRSRQSQNVHGGTQNATRIGSSCADYAFPGRGGVQG